MKIQDFGSFLKVCGSSLKSFGEVSGRFSEHFGRYLLGGVGDMFGRFSGCIWDAFWIVVERF